MLLLFDLDVLSECIKDLVKSLDQKFTTHQLRHLIFLTSLYNGLLKIQNISKRKRCAQRYIKSFYVNVFGKRLLIDQQYYNNHFFNNPTKMKKIKTEQQAVPSPTLHFDLQSLENLQILQKHPNDLINILRHVANLSSSAGVPTLLKLKVVSLAGYFHPVMNKQVQLLLQEIMKPYDSFWKVDRSTTSLLEILNIISITNHINYKILKIDRIPNLQQFSYNYALWVNAIITFAEGEFFTQTQSLAEQVDPSSVEQVRQFLNALIQQRQKARNQAYNSTAQTIYNLYHEIDIELAQKGIATVDYLPSDYKPEFIEIWLDRTVQLNSLLGNFVCKEKFGQFEYIRGPLMYAMQKGILTVFNNFQQISNELLVSLRALADQFKITHNQKVIKAKAGFKMLGILSGGKETKSKVSIAQYIIHLNIPSKNILKEIPFITNESNREFITDLISSFTSKMGYLAGHKLWNRIIRLRKKIINVQEATYSQSQQIDKLWNSYFTQQFKDDIILETNDLTNVSNPLRSINYEEKYREIVIGRTSIFYTSLPNLQIVKTQYSLGVLQKLSVCFELDECPLLVSETGCGKTTLVQYLAQLSGHKLYVYNMSSGTDVTDLIGGFKPIDCRVLLKELFYSFLQKFRQQIPNAQKNESYLTNLANYFIQGKYQVLLKSLVQSIPKILPQVQGNGGNLNEWREMMKKFNNILMNLDKIDSNLVFSFLEGNLIKAIKNGDWILIDEINLATNDVLQKIVPLVQGKSLMLYEKGDLHFIERHKDFRIVACMNPANDSGKKPLPVNLADKFTTIVMSEPCKQDIQMMTKEICPQLHAHQISTLYLQIKKTKTISLRNLSRALAYVNKNKEIYGWNRSVYDGLMLGFGQKELLKKYYNDTVPKCSPGVIQLSGFLLAKGPSLQKTNQIFHLTQTFKQHLKDLLRAIAGTELPVLLQGPTSAGKTSMIRYVAEAVGYKCIRINNHEHTEIEQYIGNYFPDKTGRLVFREGPLVQAVSQGHWLILDQLNLAKTEILQCLNRLLDDNRQLFIPQQQKHIKPHKNFRIFATQNPSSYSGRKTLSRAFRNRFVSISFADITTDDTMAILQARSPLLKDSKELSTFIKKTLQSLMNYRQRQRVFEKDGLITIRNLLKWCERPFVSKEKFIMQGYAILAQKLRCQEEKKFVEKVLINTIKYTTNHVKEEYYEVVSQSFSQEKIAATNIYVQMNHSFKRMSALTIKALNNREPVLLVGETGCGKTTLAQLLAALTHRPFYSINCHKHMEASDLLGSLRPCSNPESNAQFEFVNGVVINAMLEGAILLIDEINTAEDSVLERLNQVLECGLIGIERGQGWQTLQAKEGFCIIATMNPSGDYGKKQLSPALRNRFTQIWVEPITHPQYIIQARSDILKMINHKLVLAESIKREVAQKIYSFLTYYNCQVAPKYNLTRKLLTMRDIGWICKFINQCGNFEIWQEKYFWSLTILAIEGVKYIMSDNVEGSKLQNMKDDLLEFLRSQINFPLEWLLQTTPENIISLLKNMNFPLLIRSDIPLEVLGIKTNAEIFFSPQTDLSDLLGQFRPHGNQFIWHDQTLLKSVKEGGVVALVDLNTAQQQVIEGVNSLFDHRGSLFVVELNRTFYKASTFKPVVVLRSERGNGRKGLPNSFLNRFVKIAVPAVRTEVKLNYLCQKYILMKNSPYLRQLIERLIINEGHLITQQLQFIIQFSNAALLNTALQLLKLDKYIDRNIPDNLQKYESYLLKFLPLKKSLCLNSPKIIKKLLISFLIHKFSNFSLCFVGKTEFRANIIQGLNYLLSKNLIKIIISTMVDINDLLGTYQQIADNQKLQEEVTLYQKLFSKDTAQEYQSEKTKFAFVQSRMIRCLRDDNNLIYVEVPNDIIAERIEKGLKEVYHQQKKIILSIQNINQKKNNITKFITIDLDYDTPHKLFSQTKTYEYFPSNSSNLHHCDSILRVSQSRQMITQLMNEENDTASVTAWRRLLTGLLSQTQMQVSTTQDEARIKIWKLMQNKYKVTAVQNNQIRDKLTESITKYTSLPNNREQMLEKILLLCFFTANPNELNKKLTYLADDQLSLNQTIKKFQTLYICDVNNFKQTAKTILPLLTKTSSRELLKKYYAELERLYEELFKFKVKEILIQYTQDQYKLVPIINNAESIRYFMSQDSLDVLRICDEGAHPHHILNGVEKVVMENVKLIEVDIPSVSKWCRQIKIKHISSLNTLQGHLSKKQQLLTNPLQHTEVINFLKQLQLYSELANSEPFQQGKALWDIFKPSENMSLNVSYHFRNEASVKFLQELISNDNLYLQKFLKFSQLKYFNYKPQELSRIQTTINQYKDEMVAIRKKLVYRGHDNLLNLIEFYKILLQQTNKIEQSQFSIQVIRNSITQTYNSYYHLYSDVLLPYYLSLQIIYTAQLQRQSLKVVSIAESISKNRESVISLIQNMVQVEEGEQVDRSKDYLRFQRKFNKTVIVDQYTQEGVEKNKKNLEEEFIELFGKHSQHERPRVDSPFQSIHMLINKTKQNYYPYLSKRIFSNCSSFQQMMWGLQILMKFPQSSINIYEQYHPSIVIDLVKPVTQILEQIFQLLKLYPIDNIKNLANICNKIQERSIYQQIYKILIDCEFLIEKIFEVNPILPMANHIATASLIQNCLKVRKMQLKNWKQMMQLKLRRTQKSDMIEFIGFYKNLKQLKNDKELFAVCESFLRESKISCINNRVRLLFYLAKENVIPKEQSFRNALFRVIGFYSYLMPELTSFKNKSYNEKQQEMREYEKLAGWNSNQYLIFKATCQKFQRKIHHILKRHDEELSMTVGTYHQKMLTEQVFGSVKDFKNGLLTMMNSKIEEQQDNQQEEDNQIQEKSKEQEMEADQDLQENSNEYQRICKRIFSTLTEIQQEHHTTQSKLLIIRANLSELQEVFHDFSLTSKVEYKYLTREMFETEEQYSKGIKYYYGLWDKLCQRSETKWNLELVDRMWHVTEKIWVHINIGLKYSSQRYHNQLAEDLRILLQDFIKAQNQNYHLLFKRQLQKTKHFLEQESIKSQIKPNPQIILDQNMISLMKLGYILANISINIQQNGLCVKEEQQNNQQSGDQEIGDGVGIGEGEAHDAAQNVGDQIEFQEQIMGNKDQEKNQDKNADKKEQNDIEMENDFDGDMYSKQEQQEGQDGQQGKSQEADQQMGEVDQKEKEKDMKNQAGEASGSEQADVDIKNQKEGEQELIDNQRQQKQQRRGQQKRQMQQEEQQEKSDWDSNNQQGDKINKQKQNVQAQESQESMSVDLDKQPQKMESQDDQEQGENQEENQEGDQMSQEQNRDGEEDSKIEQQNGEDQRNGEIDEQNINENQQEDEQKEKQEKNQKKQSKKYKPAYGRQDINTNNEVINEEQPPANQADQQGNQEQGQGEGNQGSGKPIHNLSSEFLEELLKQQKSEGNEQFIKDLNVIVNDDKEEKLKQGEENAQQYEMTEQKDKFATNLPLVDDQKVKNQEEQQKMKQEKANQERNEQQLEKKEKKDLQKNNEKANTQKLQKQKEKANEDKKNNQKMAASTQKQSQLAHTKKGEKDRNYQKQAIIVQEDKQQIIRKTIQSIKAEHQQETDKQLQNSKEILSESFEVSKILEEQLKSVLEPLDNAEYKGDFKTGKKLNLKKIIPFIASNFRKDRIWLRRTQPCQRNYYIMIGLDDTKSMHYGNVGGQALKGLLAISFALQHLSIKTSICSIRDEMVMLKKFEDQLQSQSILKSFKFEYQSSNSHDLSMAAFMNSSVKQFKRVDQTDANIEVKKLCFIISDGKMNKKLVSPFLKDAKKEDITYIFIVVDSQESSILNIKSVEYVDGKMKMKNYMSDFPYQYFLIVNDVKELGQILAMTLLQFIQEK